LLSLHGELLALKLAVMPTLPPRGELPPCPNCPICGDRMELVYDRFHQQVCVCVECHTGLTIPAAAWDVQRRKRSGTREPE
jgi:hypothetical protein